MKRKKKLGVPVILSVGDLVLQVLLRLKNAFLEMVVVAMVAEEKINLLPGNGIVVSGLVVGRTDSDIPEKQGVIQGKNLNDSQLGYGSQVFFC